MPKNDKPKTVYAVRCKATGRIYVGCCTDFETRLKQHFRELRCGTKTRFVPGARNNSEKSSYIDTPWQEDYNKHGAESFEAYILERDVPAWSAPDVERRYILLYRANELEYGYNIRPVCADAPVKIVSGAPPIPARSADYLLGVGREQGTA